MFRIFLEVNSPRCCIPLDLACGLGIFNLTASKGAPSLPLGHPSSFCWIQFFLQLLCHLLYGSRGAVHLRASEVVSHVAMRRFRGLPHYLHFLRVLRISVLSIMTLNSWLTPTTLHRFTLHPTFRPDPIVVSQLLSNGYVSHRHHPHTQLPSHKEGRLRPNWGVIDEAAKVLEPPCCIKTHTCSIYSSPQKVDPLLDNHHSSKLLEQHGSAHTSSARLPQGPAAVSP